MYKILIADDERWVLLGIKQLLEKINLPFQVVGMAENGIEALEMLVELQPDVLITDIRMPGMDGLELMEKMNACEIDSKVIFLSGYAEFDYVQKAIHLGALDYLLKPIDENRLKSVLDAVLDRLYKEQDDDSKLLYLEKVFNVQADCFYKKLDSGEESLQLVYQCMSLLLEEEWNGEKNGLMEQNHFFYFTLSREKNRIVVFLKYPEKLKQKSVLKLIKDIFPGIRAIGFSGKSYNGDNLIELMEESNIALCTEDFCYGHGEMDFSKNREIGRKKLKEYLCYMNQALEEKNINQLRILFHELEKEMKEGRVYIDQLALLYNQLAIKLNTEGAAFEYFNYYQIDIQFSEIEKFFEYVKQEVENSFQEEGYVTNSLLYSIVMKVKSESIDNTIALGELAEEFGVSRGYLSNILKKELGMPFSEYLIGKRIQKAKELLLDDKLSIEEIAEKVGYNDYFYFIKAFKKNTGTSPSKYRKSILEKILPN